MAGGTGDGDGAPLPPHLDPRGRRHGRSAARAAAAAQGDQPVGRRNARRGLRIAVLSVVALLSAAVLVGSGLAWARYRTFTAHITRVDALAVPKPTKDIDGQDENILIVGNDNRQTATDQELAEIGASRDGGSLNTDTMMIVHVPADGSKVTLISFPRDSYVQIPGYGKHKLNSAYPDGYTNTNGSESAKEAAGAQLLVTTLQNLTGLTIDHFVQVDLLGFYRISNAIGGVPVVLCEAQHESNSGINLPAGRSVIEGKQALAFVRQRYGLPHGDLDRINRQHYFLTQAFAKITSAGVLFSPTKLSNLLTAVDQSLEMDPGLDPLKLAQQLQNLTADHIITKTIPTEGDEQTDDGDALIVDPAKVQSFVGQLLAPAPTPVNPATVTVEVLNASGVNGAGAHASQLLQGYGFQIVPASTAPQEQASTIIQYPSGQSAQAQAVAAHMAGVSLQEDPSAKHVTVLLGTDGKTVAAPSTGSAPAPAPSGSASAANQPAGCVP